uniref:GTP 3',8-cyclase n=1 Tax=Desulfatirhabdium butyrativorans TaxID=340467 RepID=A0A7C4MM00_9BACT
MRGERNDSRPQRSDALTDLFSRRLNYLRVSITDRCNLRCVYCTPQFETIKLDHEQILSYEEILRVVRIAASLGVEKVRITGGEPLVRRGVIDFLKQVVQMPGIRDVSLTTNGVLLAERIDDLWESGIRRINVSLDTLRSDRFSAITGLDAFERVWAGIQAAYRKGYHPIKVNTVALEGINDDEVVDIARLSFRYPFHFRFIEYMPIGPCPKVRGSGLLTPDIQRRLEAAIGPLLPVAASPFDGPARRFRFERAIGEIGFISAMSDHFCSRCNRLRLTARGTLRPCLLSDREIDVKTLLRANASDEALAELLKSAALQKGSEHHVLSSKDGVHGRMFAIGG